MFTHDTTKDKAADLLVIGNICHVLVLSWDLLVRAEENFWGLIGLGMITGWDNLIKVNKKSSYLRDEQ